MSCSGQESDHSNLADLLGPKCLSSRKEASRPRVPQSSWSWQLEMGTSLAKQTSGRSRERGGTHCSVAASRMGGVEGIRNPQAISAGIPALYFHQLHRPLTRQHPYEGPLFPHLYNGADQIFVFVHKVIYSSIHCSPIKN